MRLIPLVMMFLLICANAWPASAAQESQQLAMPQFAPRLDLAGVMPLPMSAERQARFEPYVAETMEQLRVEGASVAVVQGGNLVYLQGFGVREAGGDDPVTPDTLMMIGSVTKSLTSAMAATVVDDGRLTWDTPLVDLLPNFSVADEQLTLELTVADALCACTGLPQRDFELVFHFDSLTPERLLASIADFPLTAPFGEMFQYSNQMYAIGGYAAAVAAGAGEDVLADGYRVAMQDRILGPIEMEHSTFALDDVLASGNYASPHGADLDGETRVLPLLLDDRFVNSVAPAGALWSSARDMARYLQTQLADGVSPDGTRVVSAENLARTRAPRVMIPPVPGMPQLANDATQAYGMGWFVGTYKGQPMLNHSGDSLGFSARVAFLPEADLGVAILTNGGAGAGPFTLSIQYRLLETLFNQPPEIDALVAQLNSADESGGPLWGQTEAAAVAPFLGHFENSALGEVELRLEGEQLILNAGEVQSVLRPVVEEAGTVVAYIFADPPLTGAAIVLRLDADGQPAIELMADGADPYVFTRQGTIPNATPEP